MNQLAEESCEACRIGAPRVESPEAEQLLQQLPDWRVELSSEAGQEIPQLIKSYRFANFVQALAFTQAVGALAESVNHHPALLTEWGRVTVRWWTHKIKGLHRNDFVMAAKTDELFTRRVNNQ